MKTTCLFTALCLLLDTAALLAQAPQSRTDAPVDFNRDVRPILSNRCLACHGPDDGQREAGLRLDDAASATSRLESGKIAIVPGKPQDSELLLRIHSSDDDIRMPPPEFGKPLTAAEQSILQKWITQGAQFARHWSYTPPTRPAVPQPAPDYSEWVRNPIDNFALQTMLAHGLTPQAQAPAPILLRRVFLDLIGLPPTPAEASEWLAKLTASGSDQGVSETAWQQLVEHLLQRPEYGEYWACKWLDLARYADSSGYADDPARTMWPYRDWVIRAFNSGMRFDQFTIEQIAGDLLPAASEDQLIATAFHRNTMTNNEGGTQDEEFRNVAVVDRVNTTMAVWMGSTISCAQCHNHKYDPLSQEEYVRVFALLNNTEDADRGDDSPRLQFFTQQQKQRRSEIEQRQAAIRQLFTTTTDALTNSQQNWENSLQKPVEWSGLTPLQVVRTSGGEVRIQSDGSVLVPKTAEKDVYLADLSLNSLPPGFSEQALAAIRLQTIPSASLPGGGAGHGGGNFVITEIRAEWLPAENAAPTARFIRIAIPGASKILSLAEVQVISGGLNVAAKGAASQSSTDFDGPAMLAIDGNTDGDYLKKSVTHTAISDSPWWELDLQSAIPVEKIVLWNRTDGNTQSRLADFTITLLDEQRQEVSSRTVAEPPRPSSEFTPGNSRVIRLSAAAADFSQDGFLPEEVLDGKTEAENGWAVGGVTNVSHELVLALAEPLPLSAGGILRLSIEQNAPYAGHLLGSFRVQATANPAAVLRSKVPANILALLEIPTEQRTAEQSAELSLWYRSNAAPEFAAERSELTQLQKELVVMKPEGSVLVMRELQADKRRRTQLQYRGNYLDKGPDVDAGVPAVFHPLKIADQQPRLQFARWLVSSDNPLTARVQVNRMWEELFGRGIVLTSEEFGSQGELPTHPELLDWLAVELLESGWDLRALQRLIVSSAVWRQSSQVTSESAKADADNRWLARGPRVRLRSETVRDQALAVAGLLSHKMYGPPVKPPQPSLGLSAAFGSSTDWQTSTGEDRYRRAIYTTWRRSNPYPSMATFDAPNREVCTLRRNRTNTPLQALVTLNDPVYVEASQALARKMLAAPGTLEEQLASGFQTALIRPAAAAEVEELKALFNEARDSYAQDSAAAMTFAADPLGPLPPDLKPADAAAMTVVAGVILNLDEMLMKP